MTECGPLISYTPWRKFVVGSSGRTLPIMESKIDSPDPENIPGEICVRGTNRMLGYFKNPEATAAVIDGEGWLHTGDMGTRTPDGTLFLRGRSKTMILSASGQNIYPEEIEAKLNNMPFVSESLVVDRDGKLTALVYPDFEAADKLGISISDMDSTMENVRTELNKIVAPYEKNRQNRAQCPTNLRNPEKEHKALPLHTLRRNKRGCVKIDESQENTRGCRDITLACCWLTDE